jgi:hypothetical protein
MVGTAAVFIIHCFPAFPEFVLLLAPMRNLIHVFILFIVLLAACKEHNEYISLPGNYHSHTNWNGNDIRIKLKQDSVFTFAAVTDKGSTICAAGTWSVRDSFLLLKAYDNNHPYDVKKLFPELSQQQNLVPLAIEAKFIIRGEHLYNLDEKGQNAVAEQYYDKENF